MLNILVCTITNVVPHPLAVFRHQAEYLHFEIQAKKITKAFYAFGWNSCFFSLKKVFFLI